MSYGVPERNMRFLYKCLGVSIKDSWRDSFRDSSRDFFADFFRLFPRSPPLIFSGYSSGISLGILSGCPSNSFKNFSRDSFGDVSWHSRRDFFIDSFWDSFRDCSRDGFLILSWIIPKIPFGIFLTFLLGVSLGFPSWISSGIPLEVPAPYDFYQIFFRDAFHDFFIYFFKNSSQNFVRDFFRDSFLHFLIDFSRNSFIGSLRDSFRHYFRYSSRVYLEIPPEIFQNFLPGFLQRIISEILCWFLPRFFHGFFGIFSRILFLDFSRIHSSILFRDFSRYSIWDSFLLTSLPPRVLSRIPLELPEFLSFSRDFSINYFQNCATLFCRYSFRSSFRDSF